MRVGELVDQARLAHPRLADDCRDLAVTVRGQLLSMAELLQFGVATDEAGQPAAGSSLETCPRRAGAYHLVDLYGVGEAFDGHGAERLHFDIALRQGQRF